jgi:hypothetical protein
VTTEAEAGPHGRLHPLLPGLNSDASLPMLSKTHMTQAKELFMCHSIPWFPGEHKGALSYRRGTLLLPFHTYLTLKYSMLHIQLSLSCVSILPVPHIQQVALGRY